MKTYITNTVLILLGLLCVALAGADFYIHRHGSFAIERLPLFYCVFGFAIYIALIFLAKALRWQILRPEDYYGRYATDAEPEPAATPAPEARDV